MSLPCGRFGGLFPPATDINTFMASFVVVIQIAHTAVSPARMSTVGSRAGPAGSAFSCVAWARVVSSGDEKVYSYSLIAVAAAGDNGQSSGVRAGDPRGGGVLCSGRPDRERDVGRCTAVPGRSCGRGEGLGEDRGRWPRASDQGWPNLPAFPSQHHRGQREGEKFVDK